MDASESPTGDRVLIVSMLNDNKALCVPVSSRTPQDQWRRKFSHPFGQQTICMYKLRPYSLEDLRSTPQRLLTREDLDHKTRKAVDRSLLRLVLDSRGHISTNIRNLKKYRTVDGKTAIVLTCREVNRYIGVPLVLIMEEDPMVPRPIDKNQLIAEDGHRGDRLTRPERLLVADVLERILQGISGRELTPLPVRPERAQQILQVLWPASKDCNQPFRANAYPYILEMMFVIYYRHLRWGCVDVECLPCDTMDALMSHALDTCNVVTCPQKQFLTRAFAMHVRNAQCGRSPKPCRIPFCGQINFLVRSEDVRTPSRWLCSITMEKMKYYSRLPVEN
ncbi:uncharacterized protein LOC118406900 [Branchiostoma floridae]|uniref:Uncharacterized protein LOC118406900 n=1 Tax=Branchiostoma floridae TaxID=7739 RepID=A0A9J7KK07_BRAFL|nr:uncharacterized protein LOC118406900 [Branchiostoma floridae]